MAQEVEQEKINIQHGHTEDAVVVIFPKPVIQLAMSPNEVDKFIGSMQDMKRKLAEHQAKKKQ